MDEVKSCNLEGGEAADFWHQFAMQDQKEQCDSCNLGVDNPRMRSPIPRRASPNPRHHKRWRRESRACSDLVHNLAHPQEYHGPHTYGDADESALVELSSVADAVQFWRELCGSPERSPSPRRMSPDPRRQCRRRREVRLCSEIGPDLVPGCFQDLFAELPAGAPPIATLDNARQYWLNAESNAHRSAFHNNSDRTETQAAASAQPIRQVYCNTPVQSRNCAVAVAAPPKRSPSPFQAIVNGSTPCILADASMEEDMVEEFSLGPGDPGRKSRQLRR
jgi:hypothetical protein